MNSVPRVDSPRNMPVRSTIDFNRPMNRLITNGSTDLVPVWLGFLLDSSVLRSPSLYSHRISPPLSSPVRLIWMTSDRWRLPVRATSRLSPTWCNLLPLKKSLRHPSLLWIWATRIYKLEQNDRMNKKDLRREFHSPVVK